MLKHKTNLRYIFKIHSSRLRQVKWNLNLTIPEAINNQELVSIADSEVIRFINKGCDIDTIANEIIKQIKHLKKQPTNIDNTKKIKEFYKQKYKTLFIKDYVCIVIDKEKDFDRMNSEKGFFINGTKYRRLLATNGGVKKSIVVYVSDDTYNKLQLKIDNGRNLNKEFVPAKLESYKSLVCSASIPVSNPEGILVVKDCITKFTSDVILLDDTQTDYPKMEFKKDYPIELVESDGYGLICPELSEKWSNELGADYIVGGFCIRNSFCKGMLFTFDYLDFSKNVAKSYIVKDAWGHERDIRKVQLILTTSMLKLWDSYDSLEHYLDCCNKNGYTFSVTKITPKELENERNLNYQFIQSYQLSDKDIDKLIYPTVQEIKDILGEDPVKSILFLKGIGLSEDDYDVRENDIIDALIIDKSMIKDPFIRNKIHNMIKKRINEAKIGVLKVKGNFSIISGDPYSLCQSMFDLNVTGLLKKGEFYSKYWNDKKVNKVVGFRAPMTCHNNIRILRLVNNDKVNYWYKYMNTVTIFNSWDTTVHALNGADKDSDQILTSNNPVLLRNTIELPAIICVQKAAQKKIVTEADLIQSNKDGFGDEIGTTTNRITSMIDLLASFKKHSKEYKELEYRIICGQNYQQNAIDKMKGIVCKKMPKEWYDYHAAKKSKDKDFNLKILADKKPYFFIYNYPTLMQEYRKYIENSNKNCLMRFGMTIEELINKSKKNKDEKLFLKYYYRKLPVFMNNSTMNKICWRLEEIFDKYKDSLNDMNFDYTILKSKVEYDNTNFNKVKELYNEYLLRLKQYMQTSSVNKIDEEDNKVMRHIFKESFKERAYEICNNADELCNIVLDLCYTNNSSKQFAWDICGDIIINNLLKRNNYTIQYPILDKNGYIEFSGEKFSLYTKKLTNEVDYEINIE